MDEFQLEELSMRRALVKMDDAFREGMQRAIDAGMENAPTVVSKQHAPEIRNSIRACTHKSAMSALPPKADIPR
jgi:hypothetical protein